jgi:hypothetical protein
MSRSTSLWRESESGSADLRRSTLLYRRPLPPGCLTADGSLGVRPAGSQPVELFGGDQLRNRRRIPGSIGHLTRQAATDNGARQRLLDLAENGESATQARHLSVGQPALELLVDVARAREACLIGRAAALGERE